MANLADHYDARAASYDDSWHPTFASNIHDLVKPQPGDIVLDLACGTGLYSLLAAKAVGPHGRVIGIDISGGMLDEARSKAKAAEIVNVEFYQHSITDLHTLEAVTNQKFDIITCISALVLLARPQQSMQVWVSDYLKANGRVVTDVTHPRSQIAHITMERVAKDLEIDLPFYRLNFDRDDSLRECLKLAGLKVEDYRLMSQTASRDGGKGCDAYTWQTASPCTSALYKLNQAEQIFNTTSELDIWQSIREMEDKSFPLASFKRHWTALADDSGDVVEIDGVFVAIGKKFAEQIY